MLLQEPGAVIHGQGIKFKLTMIAYNHLDGLETPYPADDCIHGKGKVIPYSLTNVGPGADSGVQAVRPQVTF